MGLVATRVQPSVHAVYQTKVASAEIAVTVKAVYDKLQRIRGGVSQALLRQTAARTKNILKKRATAGRSVARLQRADFGRQPYATNPAAAEGVAHVNAAPLPGHSLVVLDPRELVVDVFPCEDAHAQERSLLTGVGDGEAERRVGQRSQFLHAGVPVRNPCPQSVFVSASTAICRSNSSAAAAMWDVMKRAMSTSSGCGSPMPTGRSPRSRITIVLDEPNRDGDARSIS